MCAIVCRSQRVCWEPGWECTLCDTSLYTQPIQWNGVTYIGSTNNYLECAVCIFKVQSIQSIYVFYVEQNPYHNILWAVNIVKCTTEPRKSAETRKRRTTAREENNNNSNNDDGLLQAYRRRSSTSCDAMFILPCILNVLVVRSVHGFKFI